MVVNGYNTNMSHQHSLISGNNVSGIESKLGSNVSNNISMQISGMSG